MQVSDNRRKFWIQESCKNLQNECVMNLNTNYGVKIKLGIATIIQKVSQMSWCASFLSPWLASRNVWRVLSPCLAWKIIHGSGYTTLAFRALNTLRPQKDPGWFPPEADKLLFGSWKVNFLQEIAVFFFIHFQVQTTCWLKCKQP